MGHKVGFQWPTSGLGAAYIWPTSGLDNVFFSLLNTRNKSKLWGRHDKTKTISLYGKCNEKFNGHIQCSGNIFVKSKK